MRCPARVGISVSEPLAPRFTRPLKSRPRCRFRQADGRISSQFSIRTHAGSPSQPGFMLVRYPTLRCPGPSALGGGYRPSSSAKPAALSPFVASLDQRFQRPARRAAYRRRERGADHYITRGITTTSLVNELRSLHPLYGKREPYDSHGEADATRGECPDGL
jgi:hypothetical protein